MHNCSPPSIFIKHLKAMNLKSALLVFSNMQLSVWNKKNTSQAVFIVHIYRTQVNTYGTCYWFKHKISVDVRSTPRFQFTVNLCNLFLSQVFQSVLSPYLSNVFLVISKHRANLMEVQFFRQEKTSFPPRRKYFTGQCQKNSSSTGPRTSDTELVNLWLSILPLIME